MAESSRSATRPLTDEEYAQVHTPLLDSDVYKGVATSSGQGPYRALLDTEANQAYKNDFQKFGKKEQEEESVDFSPTVIRPLEVSLMNLRLKLATNFDQLVTTIDPLPNMDPMFDLQRKRAIGNFFYHGNHCEFLMAMYITQQNEPLLDFRRMSGDGFVMDAFFREVKELLHEFTISPVEDGDEEDTFDDYSDDETDLSKSVTTDIGELLKNGGFLQLQYDKNVVNNWLEKIGKGHIQDKNYLMGLLAHNSRNPENRAIIISQGAADLMDCLERQLRTTDSSAMIRNAALLTQQVLLDKVEIRLDLVRSMLLAMGRWVPGNRNKQTLEVTESREAIAFLSSALRSLNAKHNLDLPTLQKIAREAFITEELQDSAAVVIQYVQSGRLQKAVDPERKADFDFVLKVLQE